MSKNWAIAIGVNQYEFFKPLKYAKRDAELMRDFFQREAECERVYFFADQSPDINGERTHPSRTGLLRLFSQLFERPFLNPGDSLWFFFSGHGMRHEGRDYLMPIDGDPENVSDTGILVSLITERLRRCGADNIVCILDACRDENKGAKGGKGIGRQAETTARETGIISIFSCRPSESSYEIEDLQQGAFTYALLEGLGTCATVEQLNQYLTSRVPELNQKYGKPSQKPWLIAEPLPLAKLVLMPKNVQPSDLAQLKNTASHAQDDLKDFDLSGRLWRRAQEIEVILEEMRQQKLADLYSEAERLHDDQQWQAVIRKIEQIHRLDKDYPNANELLSSAQKYLQLVELYEQAQQLFNDRQWQAVIQLFEQIHNLDSRYPDSKKLLSAAQKHLQLANRYREAHRLHHERQWEAVLRVFDQIYQLDSNYPDPNGLQASAQIQHRLAAHYRDGRQLLEARQQMDALRQFRAIQQLQRDYLDTEELVAYLEDNSRVLEPPRPSNQWLVPYLLIGFTWLGCLIFALMVLNLQRRVTLDIAPLYLGLAGALAGAIHGLVIGFRLQQIKPSLQWHSFLLLVFVGCTIGGIFWAVAANQWIDNGYDHNFAYPWMLLGTILCGVALWLISHKLSRE